MFHIPVWPGEYSTLDRLDGRVVDEVPSPLFPPVSAGKAALAKELHAQVRAMEREERAERRRERLINRWFYPVLLLAAAATQVPTVLHAIGLVHP